MMFSDAGISGVVRVDGRKGMNTGFRRLKEEPLDDFCPFIPVKIQKKTMKERSHTDIGNTARFHPLVGIHFFVLHSGHSIRTISFS